MKQKGFSLLELLVVMGILAILAAISIPNFLGTKIRNDFFEERSYMLDIISDARANAISSRNCESGEQSLGWALQLETGSNGGVFELHAQLLCKEKTSELFVSQAVEGHDETNDNKRLISGEGVLTNALLIGENDDADPSQNQLFGSNTLAGEMMLEFSDEGRQISVRNEAGTVFFKQGVISLINADLNETSNVCLNVAQGFPYRTNCIIPPYNP